MEKYEKWWKWPNWFFWILYGFGWTYELIRVELPRVIGYAFLGFAGFLGWKLGGYIDEKLGEHDLRTIVYGTLFIAFILYGQYLKNKRKEEELKKKYNVGQ